MRSFLLAAVLLVATPLALHADTTLFSTSFEAPTYSPGALNGQGPFFQNNGSSGTVETGVAHTGTQAVEFDAATDHTIDNEQSLVQVDTPFTSTPTDKTLDVQISAEFTSADSGTFYDIFALLSSNGYIEQLFYQNGEVSLEGNAVAVSTGVWNTYGLHLDYSTHTVTATVNGNVLGSSSFYSSAETDLTGVDFGINSLPGTDAAYFDDLSVTTPSAVPEPSSLALLGTGALALMAAGRRKLLTR